MAFASRILASLIGQNILVPKGKALIVHCPLYSLNTGQDNSVEQA
uniref:Uncharacterized protein n=1 Tax=Candidatus Kentrum sp. LPFa TaxID=2126335 RepID=A0A450XEU2_9GAMM|nr:MAG: hypothetical protein BECKLPF1236A_GA0070988_104851 [Candidatus Kentron sp. LPFa]VFK27813.1 MAG: hypothetical protein BECKLPF1236C_GA0070990_100532 [Candidatus Kentron sp. LPFa]